MTEPTAKEFVEDMKNDPNMGANPLWLNKQVNPDNEPPELEIEFEIKKPSE